MLGLKGVGRPAGGLVGGAGDGVVDGGEIVGLMMREMVQMMR